MYNIYTVEVEATVRAFVNVRAKSEEQACKRAIDAGDDVFYGLYVDDVCDNNFKIASCGEVKGNYDCDCDYDCEEEDDFFENDNDYEGSDEQ